MKCDACGDEVALPFRCRCCGGNFCSKHRLPENHSCKMISKAKPPREREIPPTEAPPSKPVIVRFEFGPATGKRRHHLLRFYTFSIAFIILLFFIGQLAAEWALGWDYFIPGRYETFLYNLAPSPTTVLARPWTLITSMFVHGGFLHMLVNLIVLISFGPTLEMMIGRSRFLYIYFGSGILAAATQLLIIPQEMVVLGASGAILGVMGALTALAPHTHVLLFFFIPMPLWIATASFGVLSAVLAVTGYGGSVAHLAHLTGILVGAVYGYRVRREKKKEFFFPWARYSMVFS
ncbi:MAG: rhomboid family intramembrane serine protease [Candidatus Hadarchaeales archaeon]